MAKVKPVVEHETAMPATADAMRALLKRADAGDESTLPAIRAMLDQGGEQAIHVLRGDPGRIIGERIIAKHAGASLAVREAARRKLASLRTELAGPEPSPIERLLAERAALCWFFLYRAEAVDLAAPAQQEVFARRVERAHRMFVSSLKALATVRRLAVPAVQVNLARQQINVAGP